LWNAQTGKRLQSFPASGLDVYKISFDAAGSRLVAAASNSIAVFDLKKRALIAKWPSKRRIHLAAFSPNGDSIATDTPFVLRNARDGAITTDFHESEIECLCFSPMGDRIVAGREDGTFVVYETATGRKLGEPVRAHSEPVTAAQFTPNGSKIITGSQDSTIAVWDAATGHFLNRLKGHQGDVLMLTVLPDGGHVLSTSSDGTARLWNINTPPGIQKLSSGPLAVPHVELSSDDTHVFIQQKWMKLMGIDLRTGQSKLLSDGGYGTGQSLISRPPNVVIVKSASGTGNDVSLRVSGRIKNARVSPAGAHVAVVEGDGALSLFDVASKQPIFRTKKVAAYTFSPDDSTLVVVQNGLYDGTLTVHPIDGRGRDHVIQGPYRYISVAYSADGRYLVAGGGDYDRGHVKTWEARTMKSLGDFVGSNAFISAAAFLGRNRIVSGALDGQVKLWDLSTGRDILTIRSGVGPISSLAVSQDGGKIIVAGSDGISVIRSIDPATADVESRRMAHELAEAGVTAPPSAP